MRAATVLAHARDAGLIVELDGRALAVSGKHAPPPALLDELRTAKAEIVEYLVADWMPAGAGICPICREFRWLKAGPTTTPCDDCTITADPAEITARGEQP